MRLIAVTVCLLCTAPLSSLAPQRTSETTAEGLMRGLVQSMNTTDSAAIAAFVKRNFVLQGPNVPSVEARVDRLLGVAASWGQVTIRTVEPRKGVELAAIVQAGRTESWRRLTINLDSGPPLKIRSVGLMPARAPDRQTGVLSERQVVDSLRAYVERLVSRDAFSGTVLLAKNGVPLYRGAFGDANKDFGVKNTLDTKFNLGSMNKMFTAVAVMQLVEAGKLSLDDTLGKFMPAGSMRPDVLSKVRVKHLLSHTSGLGSYFTPDWDRQSRALYRSVDDWMPLIKDETLQFDPGTRWAYSNTGMLVLGKVIQSVSGMDYFDYVRQRIAKPAGMTSTDAYELDRVNPRLAVGYDPVPGRGRMEYRNNLYMHVIRGGPAGGGYSTVEDLTRFAVALEAGRLVSPASVRLLTTAKPEVSSPTYGYGFIVDTNPRIVGHSGGFPGINSQLDIYLDSDYTVAVMSNYSGGAQPIVERSRMLLTTIK
ncbi:MAG: beta-lactamase family protein [Anaerolineae bacterium]|nr:beta-lactamase family protein [Gemmatimonadaceae bacterium]